jgi:GGDEF domain-containing protein
MTIIAEEFRVQMFMVAVVLLLVVVYSLRRVIQRRMADRAIRDAPTGTYTADFIQEVYQAELRRAERTGVPFTVALVALREEGGTRKPLPSDAPAAAAQWLRSNLRSSDYIGRMDEARFALVLPETWEEDARLVMSRIDGSFHYRPRGNGKDQGLTCSVGIATWTPETPDAWSGATKELETALHTPREQPSGELSRIANN